ncbi:hypothetical protein [Massilia soli]|uniref:Uncharacterized protein n=1 Tax=Massilia soli TaxID=2792854 RepID=A0ABS7SVW6_9BURK|nr:hypothetical protein [Massilia soli]MBZ2210103.1 hypothetical protein [Massilia soli]
MGLLGKLLRWVGSARVPDDWTRPRIGACETHTKVSDVSFTWDEVNAIKAYKIDLLTWDEIRVVVSFGRPETVIELSEEQEGFEAFIRTAEQKLSFPKGWWERLAKPAFETCETTLFRR